ncbi:MAG: folylpolyglutamate synthase/dihydrofolate synthase family protein [Geothermobacteraceae bacterium]
MDYRASLDYLYGLQRFGIKLGLDNMFRMLDRLDHPEQSFFSVHIAGTNGKGSTAAMLESVLRQAGVRTGLYTSPHLVSFTERIRIDGVPVGEAEVAELTGDMRRRLEDVPATFFEFTTAMALEYFRAKGVEIAILETGMGGRLDATNAVTPGLCLMTSVGLDHQQYLGETLAGIAAEKAGIIKKGVPILCAPQAPEALEVLRRRADSLGALLLQAGKDWLAEPAEEGLLDYRGSVWQLERLRLPLAGRHQVDNAGLALAAAEHLSARYAIEAEQARAGLARARWPGRLQVVPGPPDLLLDGAHNPDGISRLADYLSGVARRPLVWLAAFKDDKDWETAVRRMAGLVDRVICVPLRDQPCVPPKAMAKTCLQLGLEAESVESANGGLRRARILAAHDGLVVCAGSLFLVGEILENCELSEGLSDREASNR